MFGNRFGGAVSRRISRASKAPAQRRAAAALVKKVRVAAKRKVDDIIRREKDVSKDIQRVHVRITDAALKPSQKVSTALTKRSSKRISKSNTDDAKRVIAQMKLLDAQTQIFHERAKLAADTQLTTDERVKLLNQMEHSLLEQESALTRLKRLLTSPKVLITIGLIGLAAYGLYRAPHILEAFAPAAEKLGEAAQKAGDAAEKTNRSAGSLVKSIACSAIALGTPFQPYLAIGIPYCLLA